MRICSKCKLEKDDVAFYGVKGCCRECQREASKRWWLANKERKLAINREWVKKNRARKKVAQDAENAVWRAIKKGKLVRAAGCVRCGGIGRVEAAHIDYSKPLEVIWLCPHCHRKEDSGKPKTKQTDPPHTPSVYVSV